MVRIHEAVLRAVLTRAREPAFLTEGSIWWMRERGMYTVISGGAGKKCLHQRVVGREDGGRLCPCQDQSDDDGGCRFTDDLPVSDPPLCCWFGSTSGITRHLALSSGSLSLSRGLFEIWFKEYLYYPPSSLDTTPMLSAESESVLEAYLGENMLPD